MRAIPNTPADHPGPPSRLSRVASSRVATSGRHGRLSLLTGEIGSGKTTWCLNLVDRALDADEPIAGVVCPGVFADGQKVAGDVVTLGDGIRQRLAWRASGDSREAGGLGWHFDLTVMEQVDRHLDALHDKRSILIDEVGPLELLRAQGWQGALRLVDVGRYERAIVVVRPALVGIALERWPWAEVVTVAQAEASLS